LSQQINLYNPLFLKKEKYFSARTMAQALGLIVLGVAALWGYALLEARSAENAARQYGNQVTAQREQLVKLTAQLASQGRSKPLEAEVARLEREVNVRQATLDALGAGELGNAAGFSDFFAAFGRQTMSGVWLTAITLDGSGRDLTVNGRALRPELVPAYIRKLSEEPMMQGRRVADLKLAAKELTPKAGRTEPERFVEFTLSAPVRPAEPAAKGQAK
jgi:hypothetical protein